jgi:hypothetical protein
MIARHVASPRIKVEIDLEIKQKIPELGKIISFDLFIQKLQIIYP